MSKPKKNKHKIGRNDPCPCGSGLKYKKCCMNRIYRDARLEKQVEEAGNSPGLIKLRPVIPQDINRLREIGRITGSNPRK